jgi:hypothetical protein
MLLASVHHTDLYFLMLLASVKRTDLYFLMLPASVPRTDLHFVVCCWSRYPVRTYISSNAAGLGAPCGPLFPHMLLASVPRTDLYFLMLLASLHRTVLYFLMLPASVPCTDLYYLICCCPRCTVPTYISSHATGLGATYGPIFPSMLLS